MIVGKCSEETERIVLPMTRIKHNNLIAARVVVVLIESQQLIDTKIWEHTTYAIEKDVRATILILNIHMVEDALMQELHKLRTVCITGQRILGVLSLRGVSLFLLQLVFQHTWVLQEFLLVKEIAEFLKEIQAKHVHIVDRANKILLELLYLTAYVVLLICRVLVDEEVVKQVAILWVLKTWTVQFVVEFLNGHKLRIILIYLISDG
jgi:hypothetical protein